jgi:hypothetical protein
VRAAINYDQTFPGPDYKGLLYTHELTGGKDVFMDLKRAFNTDYFTCTSRLRTGTGKVNLDRFIELKQIQQSPCMVPVSV